MTKLNITTFFLTLAFVLQFTVQTAEAKSIHDEIPNLFKMSDNLYRGGRPTLAGLKALAKLGVTAVINVEDDEEAIATDRKYAQAAGLKFVSIPMKTWSKVEDHKVEEILKILQDRSVGPIFLHCKHGRDRTGMLMGLHRVFAEGWTPQAAYKEMKDRGFRTVIFTLNSYYKKKSGYYYR